MAVTLCQVMGFMLSTLGVAGVIAATGLDQWSTEDLFSNPVTAVFSYHGLWRSCVRQSSGFTECRPYFTILGLPGLFQAVRALMIVGIIVGAIGILISIFALKCIKIGSMEDTAKATMTLTSGIMFVIAGVCSIAGVSVFANLVVTNFMRNIYSPSFFGMSGPDSGVLGGSLTPKYTFGAALFVGWIAGGVLVIGGIMMCLACRGMMPEKNRFNGTSYKAPSHNTNYTTNYRAEDRNRPAYAASYKEESRRSNQKFDYV